MSYAPTLLLLGILTACSPGVLYGGAWSEAELADCGSSSYPCGPYGVTVNERVANESFIGFADPDHFCAELPTQTPDTSTLVALSFGDWFTEPEGCVERRKELLVVMVAAGWCGSCRGEAEAVRDWIDDGDAPTERVAFLNVLFETTDPGLAPDPSFGKLWTEQLALPFPVAIDPLGEMLRYFDGESLPFSMLIDLSDMTLVGSTAGETVDELKERVRDALDEG